ncbi:MAG: hypothetical protein OXB93_07140 [Cytophagales bacterium]|nr:hypothetical protein [Cytophagales bacterium]
MGSVKILAKQTLGYSVTTLLARLGSYFLVPLYTKLLPTPAEYGVVVEWYSYIAILNILYLYGMESTYIRFSSGPGADEHRAFSQTFGLILFSTFLGTVFFFCFRHEIASGMGYGGHPSYLMLVIGILAADALLAIPIARWRHQQRILAFSLLRIGGTVLNLMFNLFFLILCPYLYQGQFFFSDWVQGFYEPNAHIKYIFLSNLMSSAIMIPFAIPHFRIFRPIIDKTLILRLFRFGLPLLGMGLMGISIEYLPRVIYKYLAVGGTEREYLSDLGIFVACSKLPVFLFLLTQALRYSFDPFIFSLSPGDMKRILPRFLLGFVLVGVCVFLTVSLFSEELSIIFLGKKIYQEGLFIVPYLLMGYLFTGIYHFLAIWFKFLHKTYYGFYFSFLGLSLTLLGNLILVPHIGYAAIGYVFLGTYFLMTLISFIYGQRFFPTAYPSLRILVHLAAAALTVYIGLEVLGNFSHRLILLFSYLIGLYLIEGRNYIKFRVST